MGGTDKGGAEEGGVVELWERRTDGGLRYGLKVEPLSCVFCVGERQSHLSGFRKVILHLCFYFWF